MSPDPEEHPIPPGSNGWIDELLQEHSRRLKLFKANVELIDKAQSRASEMLRALCEQVSGDVAKFVAATGRVVTFETCESGFLVAHDRAPFFAVKAHLETRYFGPVICCQRGLKPDEHSMALFRDVEVLIVANAEGSVHYKVDGDNYADPNGVSELLLGHFLAILAPPLLPMP